MTVNEHDRDIGGLYMRIERLERTLLDEVVELARAVAALSASVASMQVTHAFHPPLEAAPKADGVMCGDTLPGVTWGDYPPGG